MATTHLQQTLKEKQRQQREDLILKVAEEVLLEKGYYETSMEEIATRVGIAKGTVYLHFPSKEDLVIAIFARDMQTFLQGFDTAIASQTSASEKLTALLSFAYTGIFSNRTQLLSSILNSVDMRRIFAEKGECLRSIWQALAEKISVILEEGKASGEFDASIPTGIMVSSFVSLLSPQKFERLITVEQLPPDVLVYYISRIFFKGIVIK
ncbi:TetR/AcrR family transcriptional regulator [Tengunoibacter tsumagoiensis]|uniref:HTH tetR-type domain-containing protein n=1 Tax=Tengunoibacter tsumagoiensis TaxID=2014871 RepID=A0A401ZYJ7_9CHLR|nr:TetR/AcrR family transcriptional regulator [Tengunoibacter tsumagoiensis]GCE11921.1 hypothetical protein KTT_17800 [Tengunoibacter tsumagoiensis]